MAKTATMLLNSGLQVTNAGTDVPKHTHRAQSYQPYFPLEKQTSFKWLQEKFST